MPRINVSDREIDRFGERGRCVQGMAIVSGTDDSKTPGKAGGAPPVSDAKTGEGVAEGGAGAGQKSKKAAGKPAADKTRTSAASKSSKDNTGGGKDTVVGPTIDKMTAVGSAVWLMTQSPSHKHLLISDLDWLLVPPISLVQFRIWRRGAVPIGFATWGYINEEVEERLKSGATRLRPDDWKSGDRPWLIDLILPFGGQDDVLKELREVVFKGQQAKTLRPAPDGSGLKMVDL